MHVQQVAAWLRRLANLDMRVFDEVRTHPGATIAGVLIAGVSMLFAGIGGWLWWVMKDYPARDDSPLPAVELTPWQGAQ